MPGKSFIARHVAALPKSGIRKFFDIVAQRKDVVSLGVGEPDFDTPWHIARAAVTCLEDGGTHYTSNLGTPELRQAIARYLARRFDAAVPSLRVYCCIQSQHMERDSRASGHADGCTKEACRT